MDNTIKNITDFSFIEDPEAAKGVNLDNEIFPDDPGYNDFLKQKDIYENQGSNE